jgi:hypothetical protein
MRAPARDASGERGNAEGVPAGTPSALKAYQVKGVAEAPNVGSVCRPLGLSGRRALLYAPPRVSAALIPATTVAPFRPTARLGTPRVPVATRIAAIAPTISAVVRVAVSTVTPTPGDLQVDLLRLGTARGEEPQSRSHQGSTAELYRPTARDRAALQTHRQVVEGSLPPR